MEPRPAELRLGQHRAQLRIDSRNAPYRSNSLLIAGVLVTASFCYIVYILFGYPLLLALITPKFEHPVCRGPFRGSVSFLIAVHNGEQFLGAKLRSVLSLDYPRELMQILVLSDGSTDRTEEIAAGMAHEGVRLLSLPRAGKSAALTKGIQEASGDFLIFTDVRQHLAPESLALLLENFADPAVGVVSGA